MAENGIRRIIMKNKQITLAYRYNEEMKRVEYWAAIKGWKDALFFEAMTKQSGFVPIFIGVSKKEFKQLKKTPDGFIKKYNDFMQEQMEALKKEK